MSDETPNEPPPLPEDVNRWPMDPETLLGVRSDISRRDLKRAYARLIRRYKPEHAPEEFRRLRAAYEELDRELEWKERFQPYRVQDSDDEADDSNTVNDRVPTIHIRITNDELDQDVGETTDNSDGRLEIGTVVFEKSSDQFWQMALDGGDLKIVYDGILNWSRRRSSSEVDYARLYWLLTLKSDLEPDRDPCAWLTEGIREHGANTRLMPMLDTEVRRRGGQVPLILEDGVLAGNYAVNRLVDLADLRWFAARRQGRFDVIGEDFKLIKRRFLDEPEQWLRLLSFGLKHVILTHAVVFIDLFREELDQIPSISSANWIWDSVDQELALNDACRNLPDRSVISLGGFPMVLADIGELVETTWGMSTDEARFPILALCKSLTDEPDRTLREFLRLQDSRFQPIFRRLLELLSEQLAVLDVFSISEVTPGLDQELRRFVQNTFPQSDQQNFHHLVLEFCLSQEVTTDDISATLSRMGSDVPDEYFKIAEQLVGSFPINCIVQAHRLLW